jgi:phenylalanyl-tRNA synthetase beta subunit
VFAGADRTLTEDEVDSATTDITAGLEADVDGRLRT